MPGANYMGGKRNAARARVKDATGKAQRDHFGKKRFEILRTGLSKGHGNARGQANRTGSGPRVIPEISLAHAPRPSSRPMQQSDPYRPILPHSTGTHLRSSPTTLPSESSSSRSRILRALDAENPVVQRAQLDSILQIPDLLGLSAIRKRPPSPESPSSSSLGSFPHDYVYAEEQSPSMFTPSHDDSLSSSPLPSWHQGPIAGQQSFVSPSVSTGGVHIWQHEQCPGSPFIPMRFDSSPQSDIAGGYHAGGGHGTPEYLRDSEVALAEQYEPTRVPFYSDDTSRTSSAIQGPSFQTDVRLSGSFENLFLASNNPPVSPAYDMDDMRGSSVSRICLPATLIGSQTLHSPPYQIARTASEVSSLPPSASSRLSWVGSGSHPLDSDVPQASFSLSPPLHSFYSHYQIGDESPSDLVVAGPLSACGSFDADPEEPDGYPDVLVDNSLDLWEQATLAEVLRGALFDDADPWRALDDVLCIRSLPSELEDEYYFASRSDANARNPTCGVGYVDHEPSYNRLTVPYPSSANPVKTVYGNSETVGPRSSFNNMKHDIRFTEETSSAEPDDLCSTIVRRSPSNSADGSYHGSYPASGSDVAVHRILTPGQGPCFVQASVSAWDLDQQMSLDTVNTSIKVETVETTAPSTRMVMSCAELAPLLNQTYQAEEAATRNVPCDNSTDAAARDRRMWTGAVGVDDKLVDGPSLFSDGDYGNLHVSGAP